MLKITSICCRFFQFLLVGTLFFGCAGSPPQKTLSTEERVRQDNSLGTKLAHQFEPSITLKKDIEVSVYLRNLAKKLLKTAPEFEDTPLGVFIVSNHEGRWKNYGLPGIRLYISNGLLKNVEYENEVAASLALELGHIKNRDVLRFLEENPKMSKSFEEEDFSGILFSSPKGAASSRWSGEDRSSGKRGIFDYSEEEELSAIQFATRILYQAGYDPRGFVSLWKIYKKSIKHSPYPLKKLNYFIEYTYRSIVEFTPLRNPIVRTNEFLEIQKRLKWL